MMFRVPRPRLSLAFALALALAASGAAEAVSVTPDWTIVTDRGAPGVEEAEREIARAFADVLEEALGPSDAASRRVPGERIFIGGSFAEKAGLMPADFGGWDYGMAEKGGDLYFFGRDRGGSKSERYYGCVTPSALAAVRFLQEEMGVRFVMPGRIGRDVPKRARLEVPSGFFRRGAPKAAYQAGRDFDLAYNLANNIYGRGAFHSYGGHTYGRACPHDPYFKTHPKCFAKDADGKPLKSAAYQAYCISNPFFRKLLVDELLRRYDAGADVCQLGQNDGPQGLCRCRACRDLYGTGDDWSEKFWLFHLDIARRIAKLRPGKVVHILSYGDTAKPPKGVREFPPNVMVEICDYSEENLRRWSACRVPHGFTFYIYNWGFYPLPGFTPKRSVAGLARQVRLFHRYGMKGVDRCGYGELFGMEGPSYWVFSKLLEDPDLDVRAALADYCDGAFGPAAGAMRGFYEDLEAPLAEMENRSSTRMEDLVENAHARLEAHDPVSVLAGIYTADRVRRMEAALRAAEGAEGLSAKQVRRLGLVRLEWNYAKNVGSIARIYRELAVRPSPALLTSLTDLIADRNAMIAGLFPEGKMRTLEDWPELKLFGNPSLAIFRTNGFLGATIKDPLLWDVDQMRRYGILPPHAMTPAARAAEIAAAGLKPLKGFRLADKPAGAFFEPRADGTGFRFGCGTNRHVRVVTRLDAARGLKPGCACRVTWLTRWEHVLSDRSYHGYYVCVKGGSDAESVSFSGGNKQRGDSPGWVRQSVLYRVPDRPDAAADLTFALWHGETGVVEVEGVTVEEVRPSH